MDYHVRKCKNLSTYWDTTSLACLPCFEALKPGKEFSPNCGYDDGGNKRKPMTRNCSEKTFNDGNYTFCQPCIDCPKGHPIKKNCSSTANTECCEMGKLCMGAWPTEIPIKNQRDHLSRTISFASAGVFLLLLTVFYCYWRKRGNCCGKECRPSINERSNSLNSLNSSNSKAVGVILKSEIQSAPLGAVLNNLDVLEELVILLDPDIPGVKSTKHLASRCSFHSAWITYTYSMKDIKSPLKLVLETITSKHPDWTVGHLAELLKDMGRNDALAVLTKLGYNSV